MIQALISGGASVEDTLELWASSLRDVKGRLRPLFTQALRDEFLRDKPALGPKAKTHGKASEVFSAPSHQQNAPIISKTPGMHQFENIRLDHPDPAAGHGAARR